MKYDFKVDITETVEFSFRKMPNYEVSLVQAACRMISIIKISQSYA